MTIFLARIISFVTVCFFTGFLLEPTALKLWNLIRK